MKSVIRHIAILMILFLGVVGYGFASNLVHYASKISIEKSAVGAESIQALEILSNDPFITKIGALEIFSDPVAIASGQKIIIDGIRTQFPPASDADIITKVNKLFGDFQQNPNLIEALSKDEGLVKAWEALAKSDLDDAFRRNVDYLDNISKHSTNTGKSSDDIVNAAKNNENGAKQFLDELEDTPASGTYSSNPSGVWNLDPISRGRALEDALGQNLHDNFPFIDKFEDATGIATSIKSTDTYAKTYQLADNLEGIWKKYVDHLSSMPPSVTYANREVIGVQKKILQLAVPDPLNTGQNQVLQNVIKYAKGKGVNGNDIEIILTVIE